MRQERSESHQSRNQNELRQLMTILTSIEPLDDYQGPPSKTT